MADNDTSPRAGKGESAESKLSTYKQKLKILKKAYLSEQEEKENFKKQLISSYNTIDKLQKDLEEKEQKYLKAYKENQDLHSNLIEERSFNSSRTHRGSMMINANNMDFFTGSSGRSNEDYSSSKKTNGQSSDENVLNLKVKQLENQIKHIEEEKEILGQELYSKKSELQELKDNMKKMMNEHLQKQRELQYTIEALENDKVEDQKKFDEKLQNIQQANSLLLEEANKKADERVQQVIEKEKEIQNELREEIRHLQEESNKRTGSDKLTSLNSRIF